VCWRAILLCYAVTKGQQIPREMQLRAVLADFHGLDSLISAGTGSGKTLPTALKILLDNPADDLITITLTIPTVSQIQALPSSGCPKHRFDAASMSHRVRMLLAWRRNGMERHRICLPKMWGSTAVPRCAGGVLTLAAWLRSEVPSAVKAAKNGWGLVESCASGTGPTGNAKLP